MKSILLANILSFLHLLLVLFVVTGIFIVPIKHLPLFIIFLTLILLNWTLFDGLCIITKLEHYFRYEQWYVSNKNKEESPEFVKPLLESILRIQISKNASDNFNRIVLLMILIISSLKIWFNLI
jgi:hypothetical protein